MSAHGPRQAWITPQGQEAIGAPVTVELRPRLADVLRVIDGARDALELLVHAGGNAMSETYCEQLRAAIERLSAHVDERA